MIGMRLEGGQKLAAMLNALGKAPRKKALYEILKPAAEPMRAQVAATIRRRDPKPDIADNIVIAVAQRVGSVDGGKWSPTDEHQAAVAMGPSKDMPHGIFLEYGTVHSRAYPTMRPAFNNGVTKALGIIQEGIWALLRKTTTASPSGTGNL